MLNKLNDLPLLTNRPSKILVLNSCGFVFLALYLMYLTSPCLAPASASPSSQRSNEDFKSIVHGPASAPEHETQAHPHTSGTPRLLSRSIQVADANYEDNLIRRAEAMHAAINGLAAGVDTNVPMKCGTPLVYEIHTVWPELTPATRSRLAALALIDRPELDEFYDFDTPAGEFRIHYSRTGFDAVDMSFGVGEGDVPVYVLKCAAYFDTTVNKEILDLGYRFPVSDSFGQPEEDPRYDVYFVNLGSSYYGLTNPEEIVPRPGADAITSYMKLNSDYSQLGGYASRPFEAMAVTVAHEFHHAIQWTYDALEAEFRYVGGDLKIFPWFFELTSTYIEDVVFDYVNDYRLYLWAFFDKPWLSLRVFPPSGTATTFAEQLHCYASAIWFHFLAEKYQDHSLVSEIWEACGEDEGFNTFEAMESVLAKRGSSFAEEWAEFLVWNYFTGDRAADWSYEEAADFHFIDTYGKEYSGKIPDSLIADFFEYPVDSVTHPYPNDPYKPFERVPVPMNADDLGATYLLFFPGISDTVVDVNLQISSEEGEQEWLVVTAGLRDAIKPTIAFTQDIVQAITVEDWSQYDQVLAIVSPFSSVQSQDVLLRNLGFRFEVQGTPDLEPPVTTLGFLQNPVLPSYLSIYVLANERLTGPPIVTVNGESLGMLQVDSGFAPVFAGDHHLSGAEVITLEAIVTDLAGNVTDTTTEFETFPAGPSAGIWTSFDGLLQLEIPQGAVRDECYLLLFRQVNHDGPVYQLRGGGMTLARVAELRIAPERTADHSNNPNRQGIFREREDGTWEALPTFLDKQSDMLVTHINRLGSFQVRSSTMSISVTMPRSASLMQNYPNPFNASTIIEFVLDQPGHVTLDVLNILGQRVTTLVDDEGEVGLRRIEWNGRDFDGNPVPSGMYFYRLRTDGHSETRKMILVK